MRAKLFQKLNCDKMISLRVSLKQCATPEKEIWHLRLLKNQKFLFQVRSEASSCHVGQEKQQDIKTSFEIQNMMMRLQLEVK